MSGGIYDYNFRYLDQLADDIECRTRDRAKGDYPIEPHVVALRARFVALLRLCAKAAHDVEWVDSGDYGDGDEVAAIEAVMKGVE